MREILQFAAIGVGIGGVYALLAMGIVAVYRGAGVLNLAHGAMAMFAGYIFYDLRAHGHGVWVSFGLSVGALALLGVLIHWLVMRPLRSATAIVRLIATL